MKSSYRLFRINGIEVRIHITLLIFLLLPVMELLAYDDLGEGLLSSSYTLAFIVVLFGSVFVHELAHAIVAKRNKISVKQIILWPLGGIASIGLVKDSVREFKISVAGPLTSICIGFILMFLLLATIGPGAMLEVWRALDFLETPSLVNFIFLAMYLNIMLGFFNLFLPIFPMDGGRVLRSLLALITNRMAATKIAVYIGQFFLVLFIAFAIMVGSLWLVILGMFLWIAGLTELKFTEVSAVLEKVNVEDIMEKGFICVSPDLKIEEFMEIRTKKQSLYPVLEKNGKPIGYVLSTGLKKKAGKVRDVMESKFPSIRLHGRRDDLISNVFSEGYTFVLGKNGALYGVLTLGKLQKAIKSAQ